MLEDNFSRSLEVHTSLSMYGLGDFHVFEIHGIWYEMGPSRSMWAHLKTGERFMAQDYF